MVSSALPSKQPQTTIGSDRQYGPLMFSHRGGDRNWVNFRRQSPPGSKSRNFAINVADSKDLEATLECLECRKQVENKPNQRFRFIAVLVNHSGYIRTHRLILESSHRLPQHRPSIGILPRHDRPTAPSAPRSRRNFRGTFHLVPGSLPKTILSCAALEPATRSRQRKCPA